MKQLILFIGFLLIILGCKKDKEMETDPLFVVGDSLNKNLIFNNLQPDTTLWGWCSEDKFILDCNNDFKNDFELSIYTNWVQGGLVLASSSIKIKTLSDLAFISIDTLMNPKIFHTKDTLKRDENWADGEFTLFRKMLNSFVPPFDSYTNSGIWNNVTDSYLGVMLDENKLGWIRVDIFPTYLIIYDFALLK